MENTSTGYGFKPDERTKNIKKAKIHKVIYSNKSKEAVESLDWPRFKKSQLRILQRDRSIKRQITRGRSIKLYIVTKLRKLWRAMIDNPLKI